MIRSEFIQTMIIAPVVAFFDIKATPPKSIAPKENDEICGNCKFYRRYNECRKRAPVLELKPYKSPDFPYEIRQASINHYPYVSEDDYCGDFKTRKNHD